MKKPFKALGMALCAAIAVLVAVDSFRRQPKSVAEGYEEFSGCPVSTECSCSVNAVRRRASVEAGKSNQNAFTELKVIFASPAPSSNTDPEASGFALNVDLAALNTKEIWGGGSAGKEMAPDIAVADISGCA